ncbi:MFS transporter [Acidicapsa ligni]|uniref:MFS transporter n=1 Tax=Acidicapsa ligni TaxID=542300 RepID=UPI0021DF80B4|nr:MFS transporter [Acidicapsa ligni]
MSIKSTAIAGWRGRIFMAAWILYAGYYICRKDVGVTAGDSISPLAVGLACFGATYAVGQFVGGTLADRFGARYTALAGACISIVCTVLLSWHSQGDLGLLLQIGNGFGQGLGWPALLKLFGSWFRRGERERVLGWWSTSYILGGVLATSLTMWMTLRTEGLEHENFRPAFLLSASILLCATIFFYKITAHLPLLQPARGTSPADSTSDARNSSWRAVLTNPTIQIVSGMYLFLKMTRYTLLFWLPNYLISNLGYGVHAAEHTAAYFELVGFFGPLAVGYAVPRWFGERRMTLGAGMLFSLAFICLLHPMLTASGLFGVVVSISLMGILIHGADLLMSGIVVLDAVPEQLHGRAVGFVNGVGSIGQALSPLLITLFVSRLGWSRLFDLFVLFALIAATICAFGARLEHPRTSALNRSVLEPSDLPL